MISRMPDRTVPHYEACFHAINNKSVVALERAALKGSRAARSQLAASARHAVMMKNLPLRRGRRRIPHLSGIMATRKRISTRKYKGTRSRLFQFQYMLDFLAADADGPISIELNARTQSAGQMRPLADESYRLPLHLMPMASEARLWKIGQNRVLKLQAYVQFMAKTEHSRAIVPASIRKRFSPSRPACS